MTIIRIKSAAHWIKDRMMVIFSTIAILAFLTSITVLMVVIRDNADESRAATLQAQNTTDSAYEGCKANNEFKQTIKDLFASSRDLNEFIINVAYIRPELTPAQLMLVNEQIERFQPGLDAFSTQLNTIEMSDCEARYPTAEGVTDGAG